MFSSMALQRVPVTPLEVDSLAAQYLHSEELSLVSSRATSKRLAEFVAGRVAARKAVTKLLGNGAQLQSFSILREGDGPTGCPMVVMSGPQATTPPHVSISHADGLAIAVAAYGRIGIDLATIQPQAQSFLAETFSRRELEAWGGWLASEPSSALTVTTAFAAKEAALKWLGTGFGMALLEIEVLPVDTCNTECSSTSPRSTSRFLMNLSESSVGMQMLVGCLTKWGNRVAVGVCKA